MTTRRFSIPDLSEAAEQKVGPYTLALVYRHVPNDEGPTIHVFGPVDGADREILRFDCFKNEPHFHLGISYLDEPVEAIDEPDAFEWVTQELESGFPELLERSRAGSELPADWQDVTARAMAAFRTQLTSMSA